MSAVEARGEPLKTCCSLSLRMDPNDNVNFGEIVELVLAAGGLQKGRGNALSDITS